MTRSCAPSMSRKAQRSRPAPRSSSWRIDAGSEQLLKLHRSTHVTLDLELASHVGARRVLVTADDLLERLLGGRDHGVGILTALGDVDLAVLDTDGPFSGAFDVEEIGVRHPRRLRGVCATFEIVEELLDSGHGSNPTSVAASSLRLSRPLGSCTASRIANRGATAAT